MPEFATEVVLDLCDSNLNRLLPVTMFYVILVAVLLWRPVLGAHISPEDETYNSMNLVYTKPTGQRRVKRQLGEVALQLSHFLEVCILYSFMYSCLCLLTFEAV